MGLLDDLGLADMYKDYSSIKKEFVEFGTEVVKEIVKEAKDVKQTVVETADELKTDAEDVKQAVTDTTDGFKGQITELETKIKQTTKIQVTQVDSNTESDVTTKTEDQTA
jgi:hypothetical protein